MKLMPAAAIFTSASPARGVGSGTSSYRNTSGPPVSWMRIAFTVTPFCSRLERCSLTSMSSPAYPFASALEQRVRANLAAHPREALPLDDRRAAAVAVTLVADDDGDACFLLTRRASRLRRHAGQWALPGGRLDADQAPVDAALRELAERGGLAPGAG